MKVSEFKKLIREEVKKVLTEANLDWSVYGKVTDSTLTPEDFIILDMMGTAGYSALMKALKTQELTSCTVKSGKLDSGYKGLNVVLSFQSGKQIKLFVDSDEFGGTELPKVLKSMTTNPNGKLLASAINKATS